MLNIDGLNASAEQCLGWPYVSPGTNDKNGIDCSGLFVRMYREQGAKIYHGSNTIFHEYCSGTGEIGSADVLTAGMAVFKIKAWADSDKGNRWYGKGPGNLSHIGYVLSANPLKIIHASSAAGCVTIDTKVGKWAWWGRMKDVDYGEKASDGGGFASGGGGRKTMETVIISGGETEYPIHLRRAASAGSDIIADIPQGSEATLIEGGGVWNQIRWNGFTGCVKSEFVHKTGETEDETVIVKRKDLENIYDALGDMLGMRG